MPRYTAGSLTAFNANLFSRAGTLYAGHRTAADRARKVLYGDTEAAPGVELGYSGRRGAAGPVVGRALGPGSWVPWYS